MFFQFNSRYFQSLKILKISLLIVLLSLFSIISVYASEDEALEPDIDSKAISDVKANPPTGAIGDPFYVTPSSASAASTRFSYGIGISQPSVTVNDWGDLVTYITQSVAYSSQSLAQSINHDLSTIMQSINVTIGEPFLKFFMPDPDTYDYTDNAWKQYIIRTANSTSASTTTKTNDSFIIQFKDYLDAQNLIEYWTYRRAYDYVVPDSYANDTYNKWINVNTGAEYTAFKRSMWVDIRYLNRFLTNFIYKTTGILDGTVFKIVDYANTENTVNPNSMYDYFRMLGYDMSKSLGRLAYVLANDKDIEIRQLDENNVDAFTTTAYSTNNAARITPNKINQNLGMVKDTYDKLRIDNTISYQSFLYPLNNNDGWSWFSTNNANAFDSSLNSKGSSIEYTYYNQYVYELDKYAYESAFTDN